MSSTADYVGIAQVKLPTLSANAKQCILLLVLTLVLSCLVDLMIELSISNKEQTRHIGNYTIYSFNTPSGASVAGGRSIRSHNSLAPPPHAGSTAARHCV